MKGFNLSIAKKTVKNKWKSTLLITLIFVGFAALYVGIYPSFEDMLNQFTDMPLQFIRGIGYIDSFTGYLNLELYQIFWIFILPVLIAYISGSLIAEEVEGGTVDLLLSNPISRKQVVLEKFIGIIPFVLLVTFATMGSVYGMSNLIGETINLTDLFLTHLWSIPYFLSIASISILISTIVNKKMKASIVGMAIVVGMYLIESISQLTPDYENISIISLVNYFDPSELLTKGEMTATHPILLTIVTLAALTLAMFYFDLRDIT